MSDPLAEMVTLLQPAARYSKFVSGAGTWRVEARKRASLSTASSWRVLRG
ncbi:UNVERIFIED_ORG: hypothetical protein GGD59_000413 [Rhizobium esperanzae]